MGFLLLLYLLLCIISTVKGRIFLLNEEGPHDTGADNATLNPDDKLSIFGKAPPDLFRSSIRLTSSRSVKRKKRCIFSHPKCTTQYTSCLGRCTVDRQFHDIPESITEAACYCDPECNTVFSDCCADYEDYCNTSRYVRDKKDNQWQCFNIKGFPFSVWMIGMCQAKWPIDDIYRKCTNFSKMFHKVSGLTPVFDTKMNTYRNRYCARCNSVKKITHWNIKMTCKKTPPKTCSKFEKRNHQDKYCDAKTISFEGENRGIRYCYDVINKCKYKDNKEAVASCKNGKTGLVGLYSQTYRNFDCFLCNQKPKGGSYSPEASCGPSSLYIPRPPDMDVTSFATIFISPPVILPNPGKSRCPEDHLYDNVVGACRKLITHKTLDKPLKRFAIRLEYQEQTENHTCLNDKTNLILPDNGTLASYIRRQFSVLFKKKLFINTSDNHDWIYSDLNMHVRRNTNCLVTFQVLGTSKDNKTWTTNSSFPLEYSKLDTVFIEFKQQDRKSTSVCQYTLFHTIAKEMSCVGNGTYEVSQNKLNTAKGVIFLNITQKQYKYGEYLVYKYENETRIYICKDFKPANCLYYLDIKNSTHWKLFPNKTIYSHVTNTWFHYGEYSIVNGTLWLCLTKDSLTNKDAKIDSFIIPTSIHDDILSYATLVSLTISIVSLTLLLTVYSLFPSLRNLPGKNLMLLCSVLAIGQLLWLIQKKVYFWSADMCFALSIALQYFFLSSFSCSNSIALHSFLTFRALSKGKLRRRMRGKAFLWYGLYALGFPCLFVALCWLLDHYQVVSIGYGSGHGHCWFGSSQGLYIAFVYPVFTLIFVNAILLLSALRVIYKCSKASQKLATKNGGPNKNHVVIYMRMSAMMGFTWLFGLLQLFFPRTLAFQYLFVVINGFQGFYLAGAFLFTDNIKNTISRKSTILERGRSTRNTIIHNKNMKLIN